MIGQGDTAPAMTIAASDGRSINLAAPGQPLVLYFYPKDDTSGCTREAQDFHRARARLRRRRGAHRRRVARPDEEARQVHRQI